jgi:biotin operon repressor
MRVRGAVAVISAIVLLFPAGALGVSRQQLWRDRTIQCLKRTGVRVSVAPPSFRWMRPGTSLDNPRWKIAVLFPGKAHYEIGLSAIGYYPKANAGWFGYSEAVTRRQERLVDRCADHIR